MSTEPLSMSSMLLSLLGQPEAAPSAHAVDDRATTLGTRLPLRSAIAVVVDVGVAAMAWQPTRRVAMARARRGPPLLWLPSSLASSQAKVARSGLLVRLRMALDRVDCEGCVNAAGG